MKDIQELLQNVEIYEHTVVQHTFSSKKNTVALVTYQEKPRVFKWFVPGLQQNMNREHKILSTASSKINVPQIIEKDDTNHVLIMQYITGENLCDTINSKKYTRTQKNQFIDQLAKWFVTFHQLFKTPTYYLIRGDAGLRNFIVNTQLWGVDFEESRQGNPVEDVAECCASILSTTPMFTTEKYELCKSFIQEYNNQMPGLLTAINTETAYALIKNIPYRQQDEQILRAQAKKIKQNGFE